MTVINLVHSYQILQLILIIFSLAYFLGLLWYIICQNVINWELHASNEISLENIDVYRGFDTFYISEDYGFKSSDSYLDSLTKVWYFGLTTLTTIGYGDYLPYTYHEKLIVAIIMLFAVGVFSIIMSNFLEILEKRNNHENSGEGKDLSKWVALLTKFND